jgi:hypothetical protein
MPRYRKKPIEIEARQFAEDSEQAAQELADWIGQGNPAGSGAYERSGFGSHDCWVIEIPTLEGTMEATPGDYIIRGVAGEFYPCKPTIFEQTYELVE